MVFKFLKRVNLVIFLSLLSVSAFGYTVEEIVNPEKLELLQSKGSLQEFYFNQNDVKLSLIPNTEFKNLVEDAWKLKEKPGFIIENLYLMPKNQLGSGDSSKVTIEYTSQLMRNISKLEGIEYYSHSDKKNKILYKDAYCIDGPKSKTKVPDNMDENADGLEIYVLLNDSSFGKTNYKLNYHQSKDEVGAVFTNVNSMYFGPIKALDANMMIIYMMVADCGDNLVFYLVCEAKVPTISFLQDKMYDSFSARLDATYKWLMSQY